MNIFKISSIKKLAHFNKIEKSLTGLLMDIVYFGTSYLIMQGVSFIPVRVNAAILILLIYIFHYVYRYVSIRDIGERGRPLHAQSGVKTHWIIKNMFDGIFVLTMTAFPAFMIIFSCIELFGIASYKKNPHLTFITFLIALPLSMLSWLIYADQREEKAPRNFAFYPAPSAESKKILTIFLIPLLAIFAGCSLSIFSQSFFTKMGNPASFFYSAEKGPFIFMSFFIFIPFRYLIMRTAGFSLLSAVSFVVSIIYILISHLS